MFPDVPSSNDVINFLCVHCSKTFDRNKTSKTNFSSNNGEKGEKRERKTKSFLHLVFLIFNLFFMLKKAKKKVSFPPFCIFSRAFLILRFFYCCGVSVSLYLWIATKKYTEVNVLYVGRHEIVVFRLWWRSLRSFFTIIYPVQYTAARYTEYIISNLIWIVQVFCMLI